MEVREKSNSVISEQAERIQELERMLSAQERGAASAGAGGDAALEVDGVEAVVDGTPRGAADGEGEREDRDGLDGSDGGGDADCALNMNDKTPIRASRADGGGAEDDALPSGSPALWDSLRRMHMVMSTLKKEQERNSSLNNQINTLMAKMA